MTEEWIIARQAPRLGISRTLLQEGVRQGAIQQRGYGSGTYYNASSIRTYLASRASARTEECGASWIRRRVPPGWMTPKQAASRLRCSLSTLYRMIQLGLVEAVPAPPRGMLVRALSVARAWDERAETGSRLRLCIPRDDGRLRYVSRRWDAPPHREPETLAEECPSFFAELVELERYRKRRPL